jgi:hypothetical protein
MRRGAKRKSRKSGSEKVGFGEGETAGHASDPSRLSTGSRQICAEIFN